MTEYLNDFVQESEEAITQLNNALLDLERSPDDSDAMNEVFRTAHTLKGNAGAMGFEDASDLAHAMEDLLAAIRAGSLEVSPALMDEVFDAVDTLDRLIDEIDEHGETRTDPSDQLRVLRDRLEESTGLTTPTDRELETTLAGGARPRRNHEVFHARLSVPGDGDAVVVIDALRDAFDLLATDPDEDVIRAGDHDGTIDVAFGSVVDEAAVAAALEPVAAVQDAIITEIAPDLVDDALSPEATWTDAADGPERAEFDPAEMTVEELLEEFTEYDDLDEAVERVEDVSGLEDMGDAGAFADIIEDEIPTTPETQTGATEPDATDAEATGGATDASADADVDVDADAEEVEDVEGTFQELQAEYDRVGIDEMEEELAGVSFGEYDQSDEVGFDELLTDEPTDEPTPEPTAGEPAEGVAQEPAAPDIAPPDDDDIEAAIAASTPPADPDRRSFLVRVAIRETDEGINGHRVQTALQDAFDLLGAVPPLAAIREGEYGGTFDAVCGSDVSDDQIQAALDPIDAVADSIVREVTDRMPEPAPADAAAATETEAETDAEVGADELVPEEPDDAQAAFAMLQEEYDQVSLDEMEQELEGVTFGEYDTADEVDFAELIGEDVPAEPPTEEPEPSATEPAHPPEIQVPTDEEVDRAVNAAALPADPDRDTFMVRLSVVDEPDVNNGIRVVEALRDAFDLLGTVPTETEIGTGDYGGTFDAVFGSDVDDAQIEAALEPVDAVASSIVLEVTDRMPEPPAAGASAGAGGRAEPDTAADHASGPDEVAETAAGGESDHEPATAAVGDEDDADELVPEEPEDPTAAFETLQAEYDQVGIEEMERELTGVSFGEYDPEDEVGFDELIGWETAAASTPASADADADEPAVAADAEEASTDASADDIETLGSGPETEPPSATEAEAEPEPKPEPEPEPEPEPAHDAGSDDVDEVAADAEEFADVEPGSSDFPEPEPGDTGFDEATGDLEPERNVDQPADTAAGADAIADTDVDVGEISVDDEGFDDADVDVAEVEAGEAEFGDYEEEFGDVEVEVGAGSDFGEVEPMEPGTDVTVDLPEEADDPVDTIKGIGKSYAASLGDAEVETVADLVTADPGTLSVETNVSAGRIEGWIDRAPVSTAAVEAARAADDDAAAAGEGEASPAAAGEGSGVGAGTAAEEPEVPTPEREMDEIQSVRVDVDRIDQLMNLVEEMVTSRARLRRSVQEDAPREVLEDELDDLDVATSQLQDQVMEMRLVPVQTVTQRLPRVVRDIARDQGKRVRFETEGEDVEVDRSILNEIGDPLIHLIRNAVDHGIEEPEAREAAGKDPEGTITVGASRSRDIVTIEVSDDGRGLVADELRETAVERDLLSESAAAALSDDEAYDLIFRSGFSTREEVTDVSGRGVGMDVVANTVDELDGQVAVESEPGEGTTVRLTLPVTVAISEVLFLEIGGEEYGIPIKVVDEIASMGVAETVRMNGSEAIRTADGDTKTLIRLNEALDTPEPRRTRTAGMLVTIEDEVRSAAVQCDDVHGQQEVVVKPFEGLLSGIPGLGGAAVLGEGDVITILDVETL